MKKNCCYRLPPQQDDSFARINNFVISYKGYILPSRYSSFCIFNHSMIYQIFEVMMSIST